MILLDDDREVVTEATAVDLADAILHKPFGELVEVVEVMRQAAGDGALDVDLRATAAFQAVVIERFLAGEDPLPALAHMCQVVERAHREDGFDWLAALFEVELEKGRTR